MSALVDWYSTELAEPNSGDGCYTVEKLLPSSPERYSLGKGSNARLSRPIWTTRSSSGTVPSATHRVPFLPSLADGTLPQVQASVSIFPLLTHRQNVINLVAHALPQG